MQSTRPAARGTLKDQAGAVVGGASVGLRKALVVAQVSLSLLLLIGAGTVHAEPQESAALNPGLRHQNLLSLRGESHAQRLQAASGACSSTGSCTSG